MTFLEEQLEKIKKEELERLTEVQVENTSFASKIVNDADFDSEVTESENYFEDAFKKIDEDRFNYIQSGGTDLNEVAEESAVIDDGETEPVTTQEKETFEQQVKNDTQVVEPKKTSFLDRLLQIL